MGVVINVQGAVAVAYLTEVACKSVDDIIEALAAGNGET